MCNLVTFLSYFTLHTYILSTPLFQSSGKLVKPLNPMILLDEFLVMVVGRFVVSGHMIMNFGRSMLMVLLLLQLFVVHFSVFLFFACLLTTNLSSNLYDSGD